MNDYSISDGRVRIPIAALRTIELRHLVSAKDPTIAASDPHASIIGYTEWVGTWSGSTISLGWDWGVVHSLVLVVNPNEIRSNISLVSADSLVEPPGRTRIHLLEWIESIPWRETAIEPLLRGGDSAN